MRNLWICLLLKYKQSGKKNSKQIVKHFAPKIFYVLDIHPLEVVFIQDKASMATVRDIVFCITRGITSDLLLWRWEVSWCEEVWRKWRCLVASFYRSAVACLAGGIVREIIINRPDEPASSLSLPLFIQVSSNKSV